MGLLIECILSFGSGCSGSSSGLVLSGVLYSGRLCQGRRSKQVKRDETMYMSCSFLLQFSCHLPCFLHWLFYISVSSLDVGLVSRRWRS